MPSLGRQGPALEGCGDSPHHAKNELAEVFSIFECTRRKEKPRGQIGVVRGNYQAGGPERDAIVEVAALADPFRVLLPNWIISIRGEPIKKSSGSKPNGGVKKIGAIPEPAQPGVW